MQSADTAAAPLTEAQTRLEPIGAPTATATASSPGLVVASTGSTVTTTSEDAVEAHGTVQQQTDALLQGQTQVETRGVDGVTRTTYEVTDAGGTQTRTVLSTVVVTTKVDEVVLVGTGVQQQAAPSSSSATTDTSSASTGTSSSTGSTSSTGAASSSSAASGSSSSSSSASTSSSSTSASSAASGDVWAALAQCESSGNPATNTGNGFYGLYQFSLSTWQAYGGTGLPSDASAATQTAIAQKLQAAAGWGQWPGCAKKLGLL